MKRSDVVKYLRQFGCELEREGGRHSIFYNPATKAHSAVPRHNEIKPNTVAAICRELGIPKPLER